MVVNVDGSTTGIVSGGCLETDLAAQSSDVHAQGVARVVTYDTRADDDAAWGLGLGCNGLIDVLLEPLSGEQAGAIAELLETALRFDRRSVLVTVVRSNPEAPGAPAVGAHALLTGEETHTAGDWGDESVLNSAHAQTEEALQAGRSGLVSEYCDVQIAFEVITPAVPLVICGSGPDAVPLVRFATQLGWDVTIVDHRPVVHAPVERFPGATVVECAEALKLSDSVVLTSHAAAVVMSHHYARDLEYVEALINSEVAYIGVLGPRARTERMFAEMATRSTSAELPRDNICGPVGLDIGGDGPDAIALAVIAEVAAVTSGRRGGHLRDRNTPLHECGRTPERVRSG